LLFGPPTRRSAAAELAPAPSQHWRALSAPFLIRAFRVAPIWDVSSL
jgi:hypothetical protein